MDTATYETIRDLTLLASHGVEVLKARADTPAERQEIVRREATVAMGMWYISEYYEQYKAGDLIHYPE